MVMGARSYSKEARPRLYPTAHISAHTPKPGNQHEIQAHGPSLFRNDALPYITYLPYLLPYLTHLRTYLITQTSTPKPSLQSSRSQSLTILWAAHIPTHIRTYPRPPKWGPWPSKGLWEGRLDPPPRWTQNRPPYGGICAGTSGICACKQIYMFTRGRGGYVRRFRGNVRPAGWVCAAWGSMCAGFWGYVRDMCVR